MLQNMFRKIPYLVIYHVRNFDDLMQSGFQVIPKITFLNLCKPVKDVIIIPVLSVLLNLETGNEGKKLQKFEYLENIKSFLDEIKNIFRNF